MMNNNRNQYGDILSYMSQIGINSQREFTRMANIEFVNIKYGG